mgnify:CR=1 FL=1
MSPFQGRYRLSTNLGFQSKYHIDYDIAAWGDARTFDDALRRSTVAHFARKVRGTNIATAKHRLKNNKIIPQSVDHVRYVFVVLTLRAK